MKMVLQIGRGIGQGVLGFVSFCIILLLMVGLGMLCLGVMGGFLGSAFVLLSSAWNALLGYPTAALGLHELPKLLLTGVGCSAVISFLIMADHRIKYGTWKFEHIEGPGW